jgi:hypothetical protein
MSKKLMFVPFPLLLLLLIALLIHSYNTKPHQTTQIEQLESYSYVITSIDSTGIYGDSLTDDTGIFIDKNSIPEGMELSKNDHIAVQFPLNNYETITSVTKINE